MYDLSLTAEQLEFRDTVRDFVQREIKPVVLHPDRLQDLERRPPLELLDKASRMGLRTLALSEDLGGAGADNLTSCIVSEELAAGDVDIAATLAQTSMLGHILFDELMTPEQRARFLPGFLADDRYHLAFAAREPDHDADSAWRYHRAVASERGCSTTAVRKRNGDWTVNGAKSFVANAPIAKLVAVQARTDPKAAGAAGMSILLVPRDTPGLKIREHTAVARERRADSEPERPWYHGTRGELVFENCQVPADNLLGKNGKAGLIDDPGRMVSVSPTLQAINLGVGRAAYEAAVDYAKLRVQGGRPIIEHQAIGTILADIAIKLEVARNTVWRAAWALDHPEACARSSVPDLPLQTIAKVFTSEVVHEITLSAAECFGAMGVMRDMPLQKYVHDALIFLHHEVSNSVARFQIAEALAGYQRPAAGRN